MRIKLSIAFILFSVLNSCTSQNKQKRVIKNIEETTQNEEGTFDIGFYYEFNEKGQETKNYILNKNSSSESVKIKKNLWNKSFYKNDKLTEIIFFNLDNESEDYKIYYSYKNDTLTKQIIDYFSDSEKKYTDYNYLDKKRIQKLYITNDDGKNILSRITTFDFDINKNLIKKTSKNADGSRNWVTKYKYDSDNQLIYEEDDLVKIYYKYNLEGDVVEEKSVIGRNEYKSIYKYEYDQYGNWIKKEIYEYNIDYDNIKKDEKSLNPESKETQIRVINYYND